VANRFEAFLNAHVVPPIERFEERIEDLSPREKRRVYFILLAVALTFVGGVGVIARNDGAVVPLAGAAASAFASAKS